MQICARKFSVLPQLICSQLSHYPWLVNVSLLCFSYPFLLDLTLTWYFALNPNLYVPLLYPIPQASASLSWCAPMSFVHLSVHYFRVIKVFCLQATSLDVYLSPQNRLIRFPTWLLTGPKISRPRPGHNIWCLNRDFWHSGDLSGTHLASRSGL